MIIRIEVKVDENLVQAYECDLNQSRDPSETAVILRQFNEWRRGDEDIPQFDPREIGKAIDAALEMIERLEAAESERDALKVKITEMEKQEPK